MGCGKRANPKTGIGAERMTNDELRKFIKETAPADVAKMVDAAKNRYQICVILSLFPEGRALKGDTRSSSSSSSSKSKSGSSNSNIAALLRGAELVKGTRAPRISMASGQPIRRRLRLKVDKKLGAMYNPLRYQTMPLNYRHMLRREGMMKSKVAKTQSALVRLRRKPRKESSSSNSPNRFMFPGSNSSTGSGSSSKSLKNYEVNSGSNKGIKVRGGNLRSRPENMDPLARGVLGGFSNNLFRYFKTPVSKTTVSQRKFLRSGKPIRRMALPSFYDAVTGRRPTRATHKLSGPFYPVTYKERLLAQKEMNRRRQVRRELRSVFGSSSSSGEDRDYMKVLNKIAREHPVPIRRKRVRYHPRRWRGKTWPRPASEEREITDEALKSAMKNVLKGYNRLNILKMKPTNFYANLANKSGMNLSNITAKKKIFKKLFDKAAKEAAAGVKKSTKIMKIIRRRRPKTYYNTMVVTQRPTLLKTSSSSGSGSSSRSSRS